MKKIFAALGVIVFLLVLLIKPFDFVQVYSIHAGHVAHTLTADSQGGDIPPAERGHAGSSSPHNVLIEMSTASTDASGFNTGLWLVSLVAIGALTCGCAIGRKRKEK